MTIYRRTFADESDLRQMSQLVFNFPEQNAHVVDLAYRLCSPAAQERQNIGLWENRQGNLVGFAVLQNQFATLDMVVHPDCPELDEQIIAWGTEKLQQRANEKGQPIGYLADSRENDERRHNLLTQYGWEQDDWSLLHMSQLLNMPIQRYSPPPGFVIRPLAGESEASAYETLHRTAFGSTNMTAVWRRRILRHQQYAPNLDLVIVAPDGKLAAFCIGWLAEVKGELVGQIEPLGVLPDYQRMGLGRAILHESLHRMQAAGATVALIEAESNNAASQSLYRAAGFEVVYATQKYFQRFGAMHE